MRERASRLARTAAAVTTVGMTMAGAAVCATGPAAAATSVTDYGFATRALATIVHSGAVGVGSGPTALSHVACTRLTGERNSNRVARTTLPAGDTSVTVGAATSTSRTFRSHGNVGSMSVTTVADVDLGPLKITGLRAESRAWADSHGRFHTANKVTAAKVVSDTGTPLDDLLDQASGPLGGLLGQLADQGDDGSFVVPGLGTISIGARASRRNSHRAVARSTVLRVDLDQSDTDLIVGRTMAQITDGMESGVMHGVGYGAQVPGALGGVVKVGRLGNRALPCQGTGGRVLRNSLAAADLGGAGALGLGAVEGTAYGKHRANGSLVARTTGAVAGLTLGPLHIDGVRGVATVRRTRHGHLTKSAQGSRVLGISVNGEAQPVPDLGEQAKDSLTVPGVAKIRFYVQKKTRGGLRVTAVQVTLLEAVGSAPVGTVIDLGVARTAITRH